MRNFNLWLEVVLLSALAILLVVDAHPQQVSGAPSPNDISASVQSQAQFDERFPRYRIAPGDVFEIMFEFTPEFNQTVTVQPDGYITLRSVGDVRVGNR